MGKAWTGAEEIRLRKAIESGMGRVEICEMLGREKDTVRRKCFKLGIQLPPAERYNYDARVYEPSPESIAYSTRALATAINALIDRMPANDVAEMLGKPHLKIPGTERVYYGQGAQKALAA
jgi:hypothetical protein